MTARPFTLGAAALGGFALVATTVAFGWTARLDDAVLAFVAAHRFPHGVGAALGITALGSPILVALVVIIAGAQLLAVGRRLHALGCAVAPSVAALVEGALKQVFDRPRPTGAIIVLPGSPSFPSGHATTTAALFVIVGLVVADLQPSGAARRATLVTALTLPILTAASRVYLGVHYCSDVVAGLLLGLAVALFVYGTVTRAVAGGTR